MTEQAKKGGKPAAVPDKDKVSDGDLEKVSGGTGAPPPPASDPDQTGDWVGARDGGPVRPV